MNGAEVILFVVMVIILAGVAVLWMALQNRRMFRELEHRERLAMIERGLIPHPELDPGGFEQRAGLARAPESENAIRSRSAGVIMIGLGLALMTLITFVGGAGSVGIGVGGAFALLGAAFLVNALLYNRQPSPAPERPRLPAVPRVEPPVPPREPH